jgi:hypothetical protein
MSATNFQKFIDLIRPLLNFVPVSLLYKFDMKYKGAMRPQLLTYNLDHYLQARGSGTQPEMVEDMVYSTRELVAA